MLVSSEMDIEDQENCQSLTPTTSKRSCKRPLTPIDLNLSSQKREYTNRREEMPIDWTRGRRLSGIYRDFFAEVTTQNGEGTNFIACIFCDYTCVKSTGVFGQMSEHRKKHGFSKQIERLKKDLQMKQIEIGLRGRPFILLEDKTFIELLDTFGRLKSVCDQGGLVCDAQTELMSRRAVSGRIRDLVVTQGRKEKFSQLVKEVACRGAITYDFGHNKRDFFVVTSHVITGEGKLCPFVLHFSEWQPHIHGPFSLICCCHLFSTISKRSTLLYEYEDYLENDLHLIKNIDLALKQLEHFVRKARQISMIVDGCGSGLTEPVETRWLSKFQMAEHFLETIEDLKKFFSENHDFFGKGNELLTLFRKLYIDNLLLISAYVEVHRPLQLFVIELESVTKPTINLIVPRLASFELHLEKILLDFVCDSAEATIARTLKIAFERKFHKSINIDLIKAAAFLDPFYLCRLSSICSKLKRWGTLDTFRQSTTKMFYSAYITASKEITHQDSGGDIDEFPPTVVTPSIELELNAYMTQNVARNGYDILNFWNEVGKAFPMLRQLALKILAIPAATSHSERSFSKLRMLYNSYRRSLSPETISSIITMGSLDFDIFKENDE